jgi:hypothetical protein
VVIVDCERLDPAYLGDIDTDSRLVHAAKPVLDRLEETPSDAAMSLLLTALFALTLRRHGMTGVALLLNGGAFVVAEVSGGAPV